MNDWNNDRSDDKEERDMCDHDFEREDSTEPVEEDWNPYKKEISAPSLKELFECLNTNKP